MMGLPLALLDQVLITVTSITVVASLFFLIGLFRKRKGEGAAQPFISVVVAARNEESFIGECLESLVRQTYPANRFEIIVVDDDSEDGTREVVEGFRNRNAQVRVLTPGPEDEGLKAKKRPMNAGIRGSRGEVVMTTDADCRVLPTWVASTAACFGPGVVGVIGFSQVNRSNHHTLIQKLQGVDFLALMSAAAGAANMGVPWAGSGQNLAYRRSLFEASGGFRDIGQRPSGDDVLLLQLFRRTGLGRIVFNTDPGSFNTTDRVESLPGFLGQRSRWASNAAYQVRLNRPFFLYIASLFLTHLLIPVALVHALYQGKFLGVPLLCFLTKSLADFAVLLRGASLFKRFDLLSVFPIWTILQYPYIIFVGIAGSFGGFVWKGRGYGRGEKKKRMKDES